MQIKLCRCGKEYVSSVNACMDVATQWHTTAIVFEQAILLGIACCRYSNEAFNNKIMIAVEFWSYLVTKKLLLILHKIKIFLQRLTVLLE